MMVTRQYYINLLGRELVFDLISIFADVCLVWKRKKIENLNLDFGIYFNNFHEHCIVVDVVVDSPVLSNSASIIRENKEF